MGHFIERCVCGNVLSQCRCASPDKESRTRPGPCRCSRPKVKEEADIRPGLLLAIKLLEVQADKEEVSETEADGRDMPESASYHQYRGLALRKAVRALKAEIEEGKK